MTRDRGYPDWLVLSARLLRSGYHSAGCVWLVAMCSLLLYVVIFVTFPPWSSQMTIILITNAMYHIRYKNSEYEFKRNNPHGLITARHQHHQPIMETPLLCGRKPYRIPKVEWHSPWCVSKNTWAVANTTVDIESTHHTINMSYRHSIIKTQRHSNNFIGNPFNYLYAWLLTVNLALPSYLENQHY